MAKTALKPGGRFKSAVSDAQVMVVKAPAGEHELGCGGTDMLAGNAEGSGSSTASDDSEHGAPEYRYPGGIAAILRGSNKTNKKSSHIVISCDKVPGRPAGSALLSPVCRDERRLRDLRRLHLW